MRLSEILSREKGGNVTETSHQVVSTLQNMIDEMKRSSSIQPIQFYNDWYKGRNSVISQLSRILLNSYPLERVAGTKTKELFLSSFLSFKLTDYIRKNYYLEFDFKESKLLKYDYHTYFNIAALTVAMLINKYNPKTLYHEHIIFICIKVLLTYFRLYDKKGFLVRLEDVETVCHKMLDSDFDTLNKFAEDLGFRCPQKIEFDIRRTLSKDDILDLIEPGDSQTTIKKKIMKWCPCGDRKARYLMKKYNLTLSKYVRNDYKQPKDEYDTSELSP